jgi:hypothetical protein
MVDTGKIERCLCCMMSSTAFESAEREEYGVVWSIKDKVSLKGWICASGSSSCRWWWWFGSVATQIVGGTLESSDAWEPFLGLR